MDDLVKGPNGETLEYSKAMYIYNGIGFQVLDQDRKFDPEASAQLLAEYRSQHLNDE